MIPRPRIRKTPHRIGFVLGLAFALLGAPAHAEETAVLRVATLLPFVEDALAIVGERAEVVASIRRDVRVPLGEGIVDLGNPHAPNMEQLAASKPDLVIADASVHGRFTSGMRALGVRVLMLDTAGIDSTFEALEAVSRAIGGSSVLDTEIATARREIARLQVAGAPRVLALFGAPGSFYVMTERAWLGDLAGTLGFSQAVEGPQDERFPGLVPVSDEVMALARPDLVLLVAHGNPAQIKADLVARTEQGGPWKGLARARLGIHVLDPQLFATNPGLDLVKAGQALERLAGATPDVASGPESAD